MSKTANCRSVLYFLFIIFLIYIFYKNCLQNIIESYDDISVAPIDTRAVPQFNANLQPHKQLSDPYASATMVRGMPAPAGMLATDNDFASMVKTEQNTAKVEDYLSAKKMMNNTLEYVTPAELLPIPDMRQNLSKDPSDPNNFMYTRTLFAPLKSRNRNTPDRFRGDVDITPIKTGWFDIATIPTVDLAKGYFGYFNDIEQFTDIQDIAFSKSRGDETTMLAGMGNPYDQSLKYSHPAPIFDKTFASNQDSNNLQGPWGGNPNYGM